MPMLAWMKDEALPFPAEFIAVLETRCTGIKRRRVGAGRHHRAVQVRAQKVLRAGRARS